MNNIAIIYASVHHNNTKKAVNHITSVISADVIDILKNNNPDISQCRDKIND